MASKENRIWQALAAMNLTEAEISSFVRECRGLSVSEIYARILRASDAFSKIFVTDAPLERSSGDSASADLEVGATHKKLAARIEFLLRQEAGLSVLEACSLLIGAFPEARSVVGAAAGKSGMSRWLERFLQIVPSTVVLQFLETYLGRRRSGVETDWTLGR